MYMHPALILAEINIIFPVFADYVDSQLEKYTTSSATGFGTSVIVILLLIRRNTEEIMVFQEHAKVSSVTQLWM